MAKYFRNIFRPADARILAVLEAGVEEDSKSTGAGKSGPAAVQRHLPPVSCCWWKMKTR
jgi:hypothetical protein